MTPAETLAHAGAAPPPVAPADAGGWIAWAWLLAAGILEIGWAVGLKRWGFSTWPWSGLVILGMVASFLMLSQALRALPVGTAYAVWTGIGIVGAAALGIWLLGESASPVRLACIGLVLVGILGLRVFPG